MQESQQVKITEPLKKLRDLGYVRREVPFGENEKNSKKGLYYGERKFKISN